MKGSGEHDAHDDSTGGGTAGTANTWDKNKCETDLPDGLCQ
jgi:SLT domain-containing protein